MTFQKRFSEAELQQISEEALIYLCVCPAQVASEIARLRELHKYQENCQKDPENNVQVHNLIAGAVVRCHEIMEACMDEILAIEGWDRASMKMPEGLRKIQMHKLGGKD